MKGPACIVCEKKPVARFRVCGDCIFSHDSTTGDHFGPRVIITTDSPGLAYPVEQTLPGLFRMERLR